MSIFTFSEIFGFSEIFPKIRSASSEDFRTFAIGKDKGFEFYWKIIELGPPLYRFHDAPVTNMKEESW